MKTLFFGLITLFLTSCNENLEKEFTLSGKTVVIDDGTVIYLENPLSGNIIDSTKVENNHFYFKTKLPETPFQVVLRTSYRSHSTVRRLWLENKPMTFDATKTDFRNALVRGSESENLSQGLFKQIDTLFTFEETENARIEFIKNYTSSPVSSDILSIYSKHWGKEKTERLFNILSEENRTSEYGKRIKRFINLNKNTKIGEQFTDFEMANTDGKLKKLSDLKGKTILLEFWASWCLPCRQENPNLTKAYKKYKDNGLEILAVSLDSNKDAWLKAIQKDSLDWIHVSDLKGQENEAALIYGVHSIPDNFLIDKNGILIGRKLRGKKLNEKLKEIMPVVNDM
ncbi:redoxin domain-containing protein [Maribacter sp. 2-571]|uniref:redoxin domain-containing protein n=1 Tax=Maribacter sp. 2-571 TaxID=3417569 RepID=UPI003D3565C4